MSKFDSPSAVRVDLGQSFIDLAKLPPFRQLDPFHSDKSVICSPWDRDNAGATTATDHRFTGDAGPTEYAEATPVLITLDAVLPQPDLPAPLKWQAAAAWLLDIEMV